MRNKKICVVGLGYIGLPTAALLASNGYSVVGVDINNKAVDIINQGKIHIVEPDLDTFVNAAIAVGRLKAYATPQAADIYIICVPTPFHDGAGIPKPNIDYILEATQGISTFIKSGDIVILESTSPVGTTERMCQALKDAGVDTSLIHIAYCPERVLPGKIMTELVWNDRVVGGLTAEATISVSSFYRSFVRGEVLETDAKTAEMCKLTENSFRDVNIALANELSIICDKEGIDVWRLIQLANRHPRVNILQPGTGVGGHCIAVDPWFIVSRNPENARLIRSAREINNHKTEWVVNRIKIYIDEFTIRTGRKPNIACLGLAFKADIDDLRESPAVHIAEALIKHGAQVIAVEPNISSHNLFKLTSFEDALKTADIFIVLVKHRQFIERSVVDQLRIQNTLDFCGIFI